MEIYDNSLQIYNKKINKYLNIYVKLNMYFIELTKPNGHSCLATVYKNESLYDLYKKTAHHFRVFKVRSLYIITPNNEKILLPFTEIISFNQFLMEQLKELKASNSAALVFSQFTKCLDLIEEDLKKENIKYLRIDGSVSIKNRKIIVQT